MSMWIKERDGSMQSVAPLTDIASMVIGLIVAVALSHFGASPAVSLIAAVFTSVAIFVGGRGLVGKVKA
jgi:hypothetical protein